MPLLLLRRRKRAVPFPSDITGLAAWYKADALTLANNDPVASWTDSSGNARHAAQATGTKQPLYKTGSLNGKPVVSFDGVDDFVQAVFTLNQPTTTFMAHKIRSLGTGTTKDVYDGGVGDSGVMQKNTTPAYQLYAGGFVVDGSCDTNPHILAAVLNGASSNVRKDGGAGTSGNANVLNPGGVTLGSRASGVLPCDVDVAEFIVYTGALSIANLDRVGRYLASKYGLSWTAAS